MSVPSYYDNVLKAHGICGSLAWVIVFPAGAILLRIVKHPCALLIHRIIQILGWCLFTVTFGSGIWFEKLYGELHSAHPIIGVLLWGFVSIQAFLGVTHHSRYQKVKRRTFLAILHVQLGRMLITAGMINGGLGLLLADDAPRGAFIAYGVIAAISWLTFIITSSACEAHVNRISLASTPSDHSSMDVASAVDEAHKEPAP